MGFTKSKVASRPRELLPHASILTCDAERPSAVLFLWHYPSARADQPLTGILPYGARTFLEHA